MRGIAQAEGIAEGIALSNPLNLGLLKGFICQLLLGIEMSFSTIR